MAAQSSLKEYLKRYQSRTDEPKKTKKKRKNEKPKPQSTYIGVRIVDEDPVWQKPVQLEDEDDDDAVGDETPQIEEDIEVKRMKRLQAIRSLKPYHGIGEDGSGWVPIPKPDGLCSAKGRDPSPTKNHHEFGNTDRSLAPHQQRGLELDDNGDLSPPRQLRGRLDTPSPEPQFNGPGREVGDQSPARRRRIGDLSPPRRAKFHNQEVEAGPGLLVADLSPPRKSRRRSADNSSPPYKNQKSIDADDHYFDRTRKGSYDDLSPPRLSRSSPSFDLSPPRRTAKRSSNDLSPSQIAHLPPRARDRSSDSGRNKDLPPLAPLSHRNKEPSLIKEVKKFGLLSAAEMREEIDMKKKDEKSRFASMDPLMTGKGAETVFRDKEGKKISKEELNKLKEEKEKKEKKETKPLEWGKGLAQKREAEERGKELKLEKERPFARSRDDPELDMMLKERIRWGDPMAHLVKHKSSELILEDLGEDEKMKESGFVIPQTIPSHSWLKRRLDFLPNRYGIRPGRHWDGVDRSTGYEKELYKRQNEKKATETEAYLWSVSDM